MNNSFNIKKIKLSDGNIRKYYYCNNKKIKKSEYFKLIGGLQTKTVESNLLEEIVNIETKGHIKFNFTNTNTNTDIDTEKYISIKYQKIKNLIILL